MPNSKLSGVAARRGIERVLPESGEADRRRLTELVKIIPEDGRIRLADALASLYPGEARERALTAFRQFRDRVGQAAAEIEFKFQLATDGQTRAAPENRWCWFDGDDGALEAAAKFASTAADATPRTQQDAIKVAPEILGKRLVRIFVSYAHTDEELKRKLIARLQEQLGSLKHYQFEWWDDGGIVAGSKWTAAIRSNIESCDIGLLLMSAAFLSSAFITKEELPYFTRTSAEDVVQKKHAVPIALKPFKMGAHADLHGLEELQIVFHPRDKTFLDATSDKAKVAFVCELRDRILAKVNEVPSPSGKPKTPIDHFDKPLLDSIKLRMADVSYISADGRTGSMAKLGEANADGERREALQFLTEWVCDETAAPCCALLGDTGIGKTTTCMAFTQSLLRKRETDRSVRLPIYLDLRAVGEAARVEPDLRNIITATLKANWRSGEPDAPLDADEVIRLVQQEGALVIFDGLDEVLVHLSTAAGQRFTRELLRILPPSHWPRRRRPDLKGRPGRILLTCRTHYFRTVRDQSTHFLTEDRDDVRAEDYRVFVLLPFSDAQIREYLLQTIPPENLEHTLATIRAVHNLTELAERPYTLSLIAPLIPEIERWKLEGRTVTGAVLYQQMVRSWLERDTGKHQLTPDHKLQIMEYLAGALWRSGKRSWEVGDVEQWLLEFLAARSGFALHYSGKDPELFKEDLRTATFLVREGKASFRFAHTSLQEFFVAAYLRRALAEGRIADWDMVRPSIETLGFLGQLLCAEPDERALATLREMRKTYRPRVSELAFYYVLFAREYGYPTVEPAGFVLDGADLRAWRIEGLKSGENGKITSGVSRLNLSGASFRGARLRNAVFRNVTLDSCDFSDADLTCAELNGGSAHTTIFRVTDLTGTVFREMDCTDADFAFAGLYRTQFLRCALDERIAGAGLVRGILIAPSAHVRSNRELIPGARVSVLSGHERSVLSCAWSPDGSRIVSGSVDNSLRIWDARSGECVSVLSGHERSVLSCAWSPDGSRIVSGSFDNSLRIWDAKSGECVSVLSGHKDGVLSCAWSPDGSRIVSGSDDNSLRIWDAKSGECVSVLSGHRDGVWSCAWSPDGSRIVSGSVDNSLRIWDARSGECVSVLSGHERSVLSCAWSPDGSRIVTGSVDNSLRIWDARSGECVSVLSGHERSVWSCAWSPDGSRIVSGSDDNSLRIWDAKSGECVSVLSGHKDGVLSCAWSPDGSRIVSGSDDNSLRIWDARSGECVSVLSGHRDGVWSCAWSPDGSRIVSGSVDNSLRIWDAKSGECVSVLSGHRDGVWSCAWSPDGSRIVSGSVDNSLRIWDARSGECVSVLSGHERSVWSCAWSPDGSRIVSGSDDNSLRIWDAKSGECVSVLSGHRDGVWSCAWSPDGSRIVSGSVDNSLRIWDARSGECVSVLSGHERSVWSCAWSPDGSRIVSGSDDNSLRIWDAKSGECVSVLSGHERSVLSCAWSPDGSRIVSGSDDNSLRIWDARSGECVSVLSGHKNGVRSCAWSPDGSRIVSGSDDNSLRIWDAKATEEVGFSVELLPDGNFISMAEDRNTIIQVSPEAWRWLGWIVPDESGTMTRYPVETFGPLPTFTGLYQPALTITHEPNLAVRWT